ncbi:MAG TPA: ABC transporter substrate-binding protein, partial [Agriterribacter sp.]|nr:ABC transporter substrate-binding protein [Agriterribacter sp.]
PAYDKLYEKALLEQDDSTRYAMYRQMDKMIIADAPVVPLWYDMVVRLIHPYVSNFRPNSLNLLELRSVRIEK